MVMEISMVLDMLSAFLGLMQLGAKLIRGETRTPAIDCDLLKEEREWNEGLRGVIHPSLLSLISVARV